MAEDIKIPQTSENITERGFDEKCVQIARQFQDEAKERIRKSVNSKNLSQYLRDYRFATSSSPQQIRNMADGYRVELTADSLREFVDMDFGPEYNTEQASAVIDMAAVLVAVPEKDGQATVVIQKENNNPIGFRKVLARMPDGSYANDPLGENGNVTDSNKGIFYLDLSGETCIDAAAQKLSDKFEVAGNVKISNNQKITFGYVPYTNAMDAFRDMGENSEPSPNGKVEFYDEASGITKKDGAYIMSVMGGAAIGVDRIRIPEKLIS